MQGNKNIIITGGSSGLGLELAGFTESLRYENTSLSQNNPDFGRQGYSQSQGALE
jgi:hypothetical protein